jgi:putative spermidine/putrescine transport system ATP-binding protein
MDEPLSNLDAKLRIELREDIRDIQRRLGITTIYVTHDQEEALAVSDRICVMNKGNVEQIGTPFEIYNFPRTRFVASFVGTLNILRATLVDPAAGKVAIDGQEVFSARVIGDGQAGDVRSVALRPEAASLNGAGGERNRLQGTIEEVSFLGSVVRVRVRFRDNRVSLDTFNNPGMRLPERGQPVTVSFAKEDLLLLEHANAA